MVMSYIQSLWHELTKTTTMKLITAVVVVGLIGAGAVAGYSWYRSYHEKNAQQAFTRAFSLFEDALSREKGAAWDDVERAFAAAARDNAGSDLAPYFFAFQAEAVARQGKHDQARDLMTLAMKNMPSSSPLASFYAIKMALMKIDAADAVIAQEGMKELQVLALDVKNAQQDMALYYAGLLSWLAGDDVQAKNYWDMLDARFGKASYWSRLVHARQAASA